MANYQSHDQGGNHPSSSQATFLGNLEVLDEIPHQLDNKDYLKGLGARCTNVRWQAICSHKILCATWYCPSCSLRKLQHVAACYMPQSAAVESQTTKCKPREFIMACPPQERNVACFECVGHDEAREAAMKRASDKFFKQLSIDLEKLSAHHSVVTTRCWNLFPETYNKLEENFKIPMYTVYRHGSEICEHYEAGFRWDPDGAAGSVDNKLHVRRPDVATDFTVKLDDLDPSVPTRRIPWRSPDEERALWPGVLIAAWSLTDPPQFLSGRGLPNSTGYLAHPNDEPRAKYLSYDGNPWRWPSRTIGPGW